MSPRIDTDAPITGIPPPAKATTIAIAFTAESAAEADQATDRHAPRGLARIRAAIVRLAAPLVWRSPARIATKLAEFAATEHGSALDMLRAAELTTDRQLRRLFFRHALDEAGHARLFAQVAREVDPSGAAPLTDRARVHARRQDLFAAQGPAAFLAFVHLAEKRGETHFRALVHALARTRPDLAALFDGVATDERFHVAYSARWLAKVSDHPQRELLKAQLDAAWAAYRRAGRALGEHAAAILLGALYFLVLPPFALAQHLLERPSDRAPGWHEPAKTAKTAAIQDPVTRARRQAR